MFFMVPPKEPPGLFFDLYDEWGIERHIALLPLAREAGAFMGLSVGAASLVGGHQWSTLRHISSVPVIYFAVVLSPSDHQINRCSTDYGCRRLPECSIWNRA